MSKYTVNSKVRFTGYTELEEGQSPVLVVGQAYTIVSVYPDGGLAVVDSDGVGDTVFPEEVELVPAKATADKKAKAPAKAATKAPKVAAKPKKAKAEQVPGGEVEQEQVDTIQPVIVASMSPVITDSAAVTKLLESNDMLLAAKQLAISVEQTFISLGGVLSHIDAVGAHVALGYTGNNGFATYMENELGLRYRKGRYLIQIYNAACKLGLDEAAVARIGWSKMKEIVSLLDETNKDELIAYAEGHTREDLVAFIRTSSVRSNSTDQNTRTKKTRLTFDLYQDAEGVLRALAAAQLTIGDGATPEQGLTLIASEWSQVTESIEFSLEEALKTLELRYGVKLGIVSAEDSADEIEQPLELVAV